jgi:hypothetical protein
MLEAGFSRSYAKKGGMRVLRSSVPFRKAFDDEIDAVGKLAEGTDVSDNRIAQLMRWRITMNLAQGQDNASSTIRSAGNLKGIDAFVSQSAGLNNGILSILSDPEAAKALDGAVKALMEYQHCCGWCRSSFDSFDELAEHAGACEKKPSVAPQAAEQRASA